MRKFWRKKSKGNASVERADQVYDVCCQAWELYRGLRESSGLPFDYETLQEEVADEIRELEQAQAEADRLEVEIVRLHKRLDPEQTLQKLPGIGDIIAAGIDAIVGDIERFPNARSFVSYTRKSDEGTEASESSGRPRTPHTGRRHLRRTVR